MAYHDHAWPFSVMRSNGTPILEIDPERLVGGNKEQQDNSPSILNIIMNSLGVNRCEESPNILKP